MHWQLSFLDNITSGSVEREGHNLKNANALKVDLLILQTLLLMLLRVMNTKRPSACTAHQYAL